jgi:bacillolysin
MSALQRFHYHVGEDSGLGLDATARFAESFRAQAPVGMEADTPTPFFNSNEAAARCYLDQLLQRDDCPSLRAVLESEPSMRVPSLLVQNEQDLRAAGSHQLLFVQIHQGIPIFGPVRWWSSARSEIS